MSCCSRWLAALLYDHEKDDIVQLDELDPGAFERIIAYAYGEPLDVLVMIADEAEVRLQSGEILPTRKFRSIDEQAFQGTMRLNPRVGISGERFKVVLGQGTGWLDDENARLGNATGNHAVTISHRTGVLHPFPAQAQSDSLKITNSRSRPDDIRKLKITYFAGAAQLSRAFLSCFSSRPKLFSTPASHRLVRGLAGVEQRRHSGDF